MPFLLFGIFSFIFNRFLTDNYAYDASLTLFFTTISLKEKSYNTCIYLDYSAFNKCFLHLIVDYKKTRKPFDSLVSFHGFWVYIILKYFLIYLTSDLFLLVIHHHARCV